MKALVPALLVLSACGLVAEKGSGTAKSELRAIAGFSAIELNGSINAEVAIADAPRVEISGDDNLVPLVTTERRGDVLVIELVKKVRPRQPLIARVVAPRIDAIEVNGSSTVE